MVAWLSNTGSIVVADNILLPGAPKYRAYMRSQQGGLFESVEHKTHAEYTRLPDIVPESELLTPAGAPPPTPRAAR